jgi:aspartyl-tRNA synthetase
VKIAQQDIADIDMLTRLKNETVIQLSGKIAQRNADDVNDKLRT